MLYPILAKSINILIEYFESYRVSTCNMHHEFQLGIYNLDISGTIWDTNLMASGCFYSSAIARRDWWRKTHGRYIHEKKTTYEYKWPYSPIVFKWPSVNISNELSLLLLFTIIIIILIWMNNMNIIEMNHAETKTIIIS